MVMMRRVLTRNGKGAFAVREEPLPEPKPGELTIEVVASSISAGTELSRYIGMESKVSPDDVWQPFGYQNAGVVIAVGEGCEGFQVGQRVAAMGAGYALHATHANVPVNMTTPLPDSVSFEEGALNSLAATALNAVRRANLQLGENVLVVGLGVVGQFVAQLAKLNGTHVLGADRLPLRLDTAKATGITVCDVNTPFTQVAPEFTRGYGMDAAFICFGGNATATFKDIVKVMKRAPDTHAYGCIVLVGGATVEHSFGSALGNLDIRSAARTGPGYHDNAWEHGAAYPPVFVPWTTKRNLEEIMGWIVGGQLQVKPLISHCVPLSQGPDICRTIIEHPEQTLGVVLKMQED
jgi:threonine dehydrogenase-like Zn-dependent dehydrogenase